MESVLFRLAYHLSAHPLSSLANLMTRAQEVIDVLVREKILPPQQQPLLYGSMVQGLQLRGRSDLDLMVFPNKWVRKKRNANIFVLGLLSSHFTGQYSIG